MTNSNALKGGSWGTLSKDCRSASRNSIYPDFRNPLVSFRVISTATTPVSGLRPLRGGSWYGDPWDCRSAYRNNFNPDDCISDISFRVISAAPKHD